MLRETLNLIAWSRSLLTRAVNERHARLLTTDAVRVFRVAVIISRLAHDCGVGIQLNLSRFVVVGGGVVRGCKHSAVLSRKLAFVGYVDLR